VVSIRLLKYLVEKNRFHLQYFLQNIGHEKAAVEIFVRKEPLQQRHVGKQYMQQKKLFELQVQCCIQSKLRKLVFSSDKALFTHSTKMPLQAIKFPSYEPPQAVGVQMGLVFFEETNSHNFVKLNPENMIRGIN